MERGAHEGEGHWHVAVRPEKKRKMKEKKKEKQHTTVGIHMERGEGLHKGDGHGVLLHIILWSCPVALL